MGWLSGFLTSSIGRKIIMSLSGLFLILFLVVHLLGNLQLLKNDGGEAFNVYAYFMTHNPLIKIISYSLYLLILVHAIQGTLLWLDNRKAKGKKYAIQVNNGLNVFSKYMMHFGLIIFIFLMIHLYQFWLQMKLGNLEMVQYPDTNHLVANLYAPCLAVFADLKFVIFYVLCMMILSFHLWHGFSSAFQTLGINHQKYNSFIKWIGIIYAIIIPFGFAWIPVSMFLNHN